MIIRVSNIFGKDLREALAEHDLPLVERLEKLGVDVGEGAAFAEELGEGLWEGEGAPPPILRLYALFIALRRLCLLVLERVYRDDLSMDPFWRQRWQEYRMLSDWALCRFLEQNPVRSVRIAEYSSYPTEDEGGSDEWD